MLPYGITRPQWVNFEMSQKPLAQTWQPWILCLHPRAGVQPHLSSYSHAALIKHTDGVLVCLAELPQNVLLRYLWNRECKTQWLNGWHMTYQMPVVKKKLLINAKTLLIQWNWDWFDEKCRTIELIWRNWPNVCKKKILSKIILYLVMSGQNHVYLLVMKNLHQMKDYIDGLG